MKTLILLLALVTPSWAQQPAPQPAQVYALGWQPVLVPGQLVAVPRPFAIGNALWGPRIYFLPQPQVIQQPAGPVR